MNRKQAATAITTEFISEFSSTIPVSLDNQTTFIKCTSPITASTKPSNSPWITFSIINNKTLTSTYGEYRSNRYKRIGIISCQVFTPEGTGTSTGADICEEIISIFEGKRISTDIVFTYGDYIHIGSTQTGWYQFDITIYFSFFEKK